NSDAPLRIRTADPPACRDGISNAKTEQLGPVGDRPWDVAGSLRDGGGAPARGGALPRGGQLKVVTTRMRPGYLQRNGVPYSANAVVTEYFNRTEEPHGDSFLIVTTVVEAPPYLASRFARSSHFKREPDGSKWTPTGCD